MIKLKKQQVLSLVLLPLLSCMAFGEKEKKHSCRVLFLERPSTAPQTLHLFDGTSSQEIELPKMNLSAVYELPAGNLTLALLTKPIDNPEELPSGAPVTKVPEGVTDYYLLVFSDPSNQVAPVSMQVVNAAADKLRLGQTLWFNLTDLEIGGKLGSEKLSIKPKSSSTTNAPSSEPDSYEVSIAYRVVGNDLTYPICETLWTHNPLTRNLAFIVENKEKRTPRIYVFPDFREIAKIEEPR